METKALGPVEIKSEDQGTFEAVFSRFNVRDHDGDVTLKSAFQHGQRVKISAFNHGSWEGNLPVGVGEIHVLDDMAVVKGRFFMNTTMGRDTFHVVKELGDLGEWSYGFTIPEDGYEHGEFEGKSVRILKRLNVYEVSPVLKGAGVGTATLAVKSHGASFAGQCEQVLTSLDSLVTRSADVLTKRRAEGKGFGEESAELLRKIASKLTEINELLDEEPEPETKQDESALTDAQREWLRWVAGQVS